MQTATRMTMRIRLTVLMAAALLLLLPQGTYAKDESSWIGRIETRPTNGSVGTWTVSGHSFTANSATQINEEAGPLSVGACAEVKYVSAGSTDSATRIERQLDSVCGGSNNNGAQAKVGRPAHNNHGISHARGNHLGRVGCHNVDMAHSIGNAAEPHPATSSATPNTSTCPYI